MKTTINKIMMAGAIALSAIFSSCNNDFTENYYPLPSGGGGDEPVTPSGYDEQYRPQIHYSPAKNWINDPNGMVYVDGTWHLFYQYNPQGNSWGNMSWGHATSTDLAHWEEQDVALTKSTIGDIFSGSCVIDKDNTAGFGAGAMVAIYTGNGDKQQQGIAYSTDGGETFTQYSNNPVIANTDKADFRDPKVFWYEAGSKWVMALARGYEYKMDFYSSTNLKDWTYMSSFSATNERQKKGQWECPDLFPLTIGGQQKWVLLASVNPGGPTAGSGTMYFVGNFDGTNFTADNADYPLWLDYGMDNYAGVTWSGTGDRKVMIGWMNNWNYAGSVPCDPWRSAMTLPRELSLANYNGTTLLASKVVSEIDALAGDWSNFTSGGTFPTGDSYQLQVTVSTTDNQTIQLYNEAGETFGITLNAAAKKLIVARNAQTGDASFSGSFSIPSVQAPLNTDANTITLNIYIDQSSVEIFSEDGTLVMTNLVFPGSIYDKVTFTNGTAKVRTLKNIWR